MRPAAGQVCKWRKQPFSIVVRPMRRPEITICTFHRYDSRNSMAPVSHGSVPIIVLRISLWLRLRLVVYGYCLAHYFTAARFWLGLARPCQLGIPLLYMGLQIPTSA
jgi:hypothetical protein